MLGIRRASFLEAPLDVGLRLWFSREGGFQFGRGRFRQWALRFCRDRCLLGCDCLSLSLAIDEGTLNGSIVIVVVIVVINFG